MKPLFRAILAVATLCLATAAAQAQSSGNEFPTPNGSLTPGGALLLPCGSIVNGQPVYCPPGPQNPLPVTVENLTSPTGVVEASSTPVNGTIATTDTFQSLLAQNAARKSCAIQNQGANMQYISAAVSPSLANSFQLAPGKTFNCASPGGVTITDALEITGTAGDAYSGLSQ